MSQKLRNIFQSKNHAILLNDKTRCREVECREGLLVQDILHKACTSLKIAPIGRFFFGLKGLKNQCYICPYLPVPPGNQRYQLRVFVSPAQSNFQFQMVSRVLLHYYYHQVREDFINGSLYPPVSVNNAIWMVATDMAKEAIQKNKSFNDFTHTDILHLSSPSLKEKWRDDPSVVDMLETTFDKFLEAYKRFRNSDEGSDNFPDHFHCRYLEIYEQDDHCGTHLFQLKESTFPQSTFHRRSRESVVILAVSPKKGIYKFNFKEKKQNDIKELCKLVEIQGVTLDEKSLMASITCVLPSHHHDDPAPTTTHRLHFKTREDVLSFFTVVDAYYRIKVDANSTVLRLENTSLTPSPSFTSLPNTELYYAPICHEAVQKVLEKFGTPEGSFLVRQSRSHDNSFVLSLCHNNRVLNFRIVQFGNGTVSLSNPRHSDDDGTDTEWTADSLEELIESHKTSKVGLPILLTANCSPTVYGPIPLIPTDKEEESDSNCLYGSTRGSTSLSSRSSPSSSPPPPPPPLPLPLPDHIKELMEKGVQYIDYYNLTLEEELGSGHFSTVWGGYWGDKKVAVKVPSGLTLSSANVVMKDLTREIEVMASLDHPHIVKLFGITHTAHYVNCLKTVMMVVMEFVEGGSLGSHLEKLRRTERATAESVLANKKLNFIQYSCQIAEAMEYLGENKLVHRDLATRNVLVVSPTTVKVSDFGLARQFKEDKNYYPATQNKDVPIYWFAPECLQFPQKFTNKSDVWSYGVTLWELFSLGNNPRIYLNPVIQGKPANEIFRTLVEYYLVPTNRLPLRSPLPQNVYNLLQQCWSFHPADRPSFTELKDKMLTLTY